MTSRSPDVLKVSVIIPTYNMASYLPFALLSAIDDTSVTREIIVVDDGSTDETMSTIEPYLGQIRYIRRDGSAGPSVARNAAIEVAGGEYIRLLDADDILVRGSLRVQAEALDRQPQAAMVWGQARVIDQHGVICGERLSTPPSDTELVSSESAFRWLLTRNQICTSAVMVRRSSLASAGLFDPRSEPGEDWAMWLSLTNESDVAYASSPVVYYRNHPDSITAHYTVAKKQTSHTYALGRLFDSPNVRYPHLKNLAYARLDSALALTAAELRDRPAVLRHFAQSLRRRPAQLFDGVTARAAAETAKSLLPRGVVRAISGVRTARRRRFISESVRTAVQFPVASERGDEALEVSADG